MSTWNFLNMNGKFSNVNEENMNVNLECEKRKKYGIINMDMNEGYEGE